MVRVLGPSFRETEEGICCEEGLLRQNSWTVEKMQFRCE